MESATLLEIDEATNKAATETRIKPTHCKYPVVGIPWQVIPYPNCTLARQEVGYVGTHLQLGEAHVMASVELRFSVKYPAAFLIFMLQGEITFVNQFGKQVAQAKASHFFMAYSPRQTFRYKMPEGVHSILAICMDIDWLLPFSESYPAFSQLLKSWKMGLKGEVILPMCPIGQLTKQHLDNMRTAINFSLEDVFKVPHSIRECLKIYHRLLLIPQMRKLEQNNIRCASRIQEYINENYNLPTTCSEGVIAQKLNLSKWKVRAVVSQNWGTTVHGYVERLRMEKAKSLLENTANKIKEIALGCGYWDAAHFTKAFKRYYGSTPKNIRTTTNASSAVGNSKTCNFFCSKL